MSKTEKPLTEFSVEYRVVRDSAQAGYTQIYGVDYSIEQNALDTRDALNEQWGTEAWRIQTRRVEKWQD